MAIDPKQIQAAEKLAAAMVQIAQQTAQMNQNIGAYSKTLQDLAASMGNVFNDASSAAEKMAENARNAREATEEGVTGTIESVKSMADETIEAAERANVRLERLAQQLVDSEENAHKKRQEQLEKDIKGINNLGDAFNFLRGQLEEAAKKSAKWAAVLGAATGAMSGLKQGITNVLAIGKGMLGFTSSLIDSLFNIGAAIIAIPFKMFNALIGMATSGGNELAQAIESLRKEFGRLTGPTPKAILGLSTSMKGFGDTGLSVWRVFGNLAQRIEMLTKLAGAMGASFGLVRREFEDNGGALLAYQKGLGLADEDMKALAERSITAGSKLGDSLRDMTKHAEGMGKAFNMDAKVISRDMGKAAADVKHFANTSAKELSVAVTYSRNLGVELGKIVGIMDSFETFDQAAENSAKLSQTFGAQVDAFKMMEAQNPSDQIEMVRKAMREAGQDASTFNKQQLKLLASTVGLDEATASQVFSLKNQGKSLEEIRAEADKNEKKTLTQAEAMKKLSDSIERMVQSGSSGGGFFERFFKGFLDGLSWTKEFQGLLRNLNISLFSTEQIGRQTGLTFLDAFPPLKEFFQGLKDFFEPAHFTKFFTKFSDVLKKFFNDAATGKFSFGELMDTLKKNFFDFFDDQEGPGRKILNGFSGIMNVIKGIVISALGWISEKMASAITLFVDFISNPKETLAKANASGGASAVTAFLAPLGIAIEHAWDVLKDSVYGLFKTVGKKIFEYLTSNEFYDLIKPALPILAAVLFGPMIGQAILGAISGVASQLVAKGAQAAFTKMFGNKAVTGALGDAASKQMAAAADKMKVAADTMAKSAEAGAGAKVIEKFNIDWKKVGLFLAGLALTVVIGLVGLAGALALLEGKDPKTAMLAIGTVVSLMMSMVPVGFAMKLVSEISVDWAKATKTLGAIAGIMTVSMLAVFGAAALFEASTIAKAFMVVGVMAAFGLALIPLAGSLFLLSKTGDKIAGQMGNIALGLLAIGGAIVIMVAEAGLIHAALSQINRDSFDQSVNLIKNIASMFIDTAKVMAPAIALGVAIASGSGIGAGIVAGTFTGGLTAMSIAVGTLITIAKSVMKELMEMPMTSAMQENVKTFSGLITAIGSIVGVFASMLNVIKPQTPEQYNDIAKNIDAIKGFMTEVIHGKDGTGGLIGIINSIKSSIETLGKGTPELREGAKIFSEIIGALGGLLSAMNPDAAGVAGAASSNASVGFLGLVNFDFGKGEIQKDLLQKAQDYVRTMTAQLTDVVTVVKNMLLQLKTANFGENDLKAAEKIAPIFGAVGQLTGALKFDPAILAVLKDSSGKVDPAALEKVSGLVRSSTGALTDVIKTARENLVPLVQSLEGVKIPSNEKLALLKLFVPLLTAGLNFLAGMASMAAMVGSKPINSPVGPLEVARQFLIKVKDVAKDLFEQMPEFLKKAIEGIALINLPKEDLSKKMKAIEPIIAAMKSVFDILNSMASIVPEDSGETLKKAKSMGKSIMNTGSILSALFIPALAGEFGFEDAPIKFFLGSLNLIDLMLPSDADLKSRQKTATTISTIGGMVKTMNDAINSVPNVEDSVIKTKVANFNAIATNLKDFKFDVLSSSLTTIQPFVNSLSDIGSKIKTDALAPAIKSVGDIIEAVQKLDKLLADVAAAKPIDLKAKLGQIASSAGLGAKASYTVNSNPIIMEVNMQVYMDATTVEHAMVTQSSSVIRDRLNYLQDVGLPSKEGGTRESNGWRIESGMGVIPNVNSHK